MLQGKVNKLHASSKAREKLREQVTQNPLQLGQCGYSDSKQHLEESQAAAVSSSSSMPFAEALANKLDNEYDSEAVNLALSMFDTIEHEKNAQVCC